MQYPHLAAAVWFFVLGFSPALAGTIASDNEGLKLDIEATLPGFEQFDRGEVLPHYWKNWTKESASSQGAGVHPQDRKGVAAEGLEKIEPGVARLERMQVKELTLSDVGLGALKFVGIVVSIPVVLTGYLGLLFLEHSFETGASYGFG